MSNTVNNNAVTRGLPASRFRKKLLATAITLITGSAASVSSAGLTSGSTLQFNLGSAQVIGCANGTIPPCTNNVHDITDIVGSYFAFDVNSNGVYQPNEKTPVGSFRGIEIGAIQLAGGSHTGPVDGSELPDIDLPWTFFGSTGMHQTTAPVLVLTDSGATKSLDMSGWNVTWNGIPSIPLVQTGPATINCSADCNDGENYSLDATFHVNGAGFTTVNYALHLEGTVSGPGTPLPPTKGVSVQLPGGTVQECSAHGGSQVMATAGIVTNDPADITSVSWTLDGAPAGSGSAVDIFTPLGTHTLAVNVETVSSGSFQGTKQITIRDTQSPPFDIRFVDNRTEDVITEVTGDGRHFVRVDYDVNDTCDPNATATGVAVPVHTIQDGEVIRIVKKRIAKTKLGVSAINITAEATDASGNRSFRNSSLIVTD